MKLASTDSRSFAALRMTAVAACAALLACTNGQSTDATNQLICPASTAVLDDPGLGAFSIFALTIGTALGDAVTRMSVHDALVSPSSPTIGAGPAIDLRDCAPGTLVRRLLDAGTLRTGGNSAELCASLQSYLGVALWVNDDRFATDWNGTNALVVTAVASQSNGPLPTHGYLAPCNVVTFQVSNPPRPLLVVLAVSPLDYRYH